MERSINQIIVITTFFALGATGMAQSGKPVPAFQVGGVTIKIPTPHRDLVNVPKKDSAVLDVFVPDQNLMITSYVKPSDLKLIRAKDESLQMDHYAMVQISRRVEKRDISSAQFRQVASVMENQFGSILKKAKGETENQINKRFKALELEGKVDIGKPLPVGGFFSKPDAYGFGMLIPVNVDGKSLGRMAMGGAIVRVNKRLINCYLYRDYKGSKTIVTLRKEAEDWIDAVLKADR